MPITRQEKLRKEASTEETPTTSEGTTSTETSTGTGTISTATGTATTEQTGTSEPSTAPSTATTTKTKTMSTVRSSKPNVAPTQPADATQPIVQGQSRTIEKGSVKQPEPRSPNKKGGGGESTHSRKKAQKIAQARLELLRSKMEFDAARLAALEAESEAEDDIEKEVNSVQSGAEVHERVDSWLGEHQQCPILAISDAPHYPIEAPVISEVRQQNYPAEHIETPAGAGSDIKHLAEAITRAVQAAQRPKFIELPFFGGFHQEWLPFRAAYYETEKMYSPVENTNRLRRNLKGRAREAVEGLLITSASPTDIMKTLESRFGRPETIAMREMETLRGLPRLNDSARDTCIFASKVTNVVAILKTLNCVNYMYHPEVSKAILDKLTTTLRHRYYDFAALQTKEDPDLLKLEKFLRREAELCGPYALPEQITSQGSADRPTRLPDPKKGPQTKAQRTNNVIESTQVPKCPVCTKEHTTIECEQFKGLNANNRWELAKRINLCFRCLRRRNRTHKCRANVCGVGGCDRSHHKMLHPDEAIEKQDDNEATEVINSAWTIPKKRSYLKIIPVRVEGSKGAVNTYALMDDGSTVTLIDNDIAVRVGATGPVDPLKIESISDMKTSESASRRVTIKLTGHNKQSEHIQARTVKNLHVSSQRIPREIVNRCRHLYDIQKYITYAEVKPQILIGQDNWHLLMTTEVRRGDKDQPVASLTPLGWVLHGSHTRTYGRNIDFVSQVTEDTDHNIETLVKQYFEMDALCIQPKKPKSDPEERALRILEKTTKKIEGRYETGLLWNTEEVTFPDNYENSLKRLHSIERKIDRDSQLKQKYTEQMEALITKGYAELAPKQKIAGKTWYLPHFAVVNPMKPDKLRVVHDAAAKTRGVALNDMLLKGPDLLQSLPGVVMRFRQHAVAVTADVREMFMQVKLRNEDRDALRYLWRRDRRDNNPPEEYRMTSLIFGASSSPSTAIYIKNLNAKQYEHTHPEAAAAIIEKHYVDDYLDSFQSIEDAVRITKSVREIHSKANFELKQWKSNSPRLLEELGEDTPTDKIELYQTGDKTERVLGVIWSLNSDELTYDVSRIAPTCVNGNAPTKREALRIVMSLFDPLGFASPVTTKAKQILQEVWRRGTSWDEKLDPDLAEQWQDWMDHLTSLTEVKIPRRYLHYSDATSIQLHVFTDASETAYSAVVYWRTVSPNGKIGLSLVVAKAKVAPLKLTSIPRLELQAAVMGTRLAATVIEEHERKPDSKVFWTDSKTVLAWIRNGSRSYKPFVAHRLAAIEETSKVAEWRWVPTKLNVADDATREVPTAFNQHHRWYTGPDFLGETDDHWPTEASPPEKKEHSGEERVNHVAEKNKQNLTDALPEVSRFSSWDRLRYSTARVLQFIQLCRTPKQTVHYRRIRRNTEADPSWRQTITAAKRQPRRAKTTTTLPDRTYVPVSAELLRKAEELLMRSSQENTFVNEIEDLKNNRTLNKDSRLYTLSVEYINGIVRLRSRIQAVSDVTEEFKSPMVLDGDHPTIKLWVKHIHQQLHHAGVEATVNECRQQYWVLRVRPTTKMIVKRCLFCRMKTQAPPYPRTGNLPACRLAHRKRPFTFTGVDYFGPLSVTVGRSRQKRYVAIFTCLTMRAIHLEIAGSLSTDSAVMALRRMIARRGCPTEIWSDNGTNLKGADRELRKAIDSATATEAAKRTISWRYIPPGAPFMGGAWERMVRSVKIALAATLHERHPNEEVLSTLLAEVEYTVNSRPLTHVSVSPDDPEALTPNHFLLGGPGRVPLPGTFDERDAVSRSTWRAAQRLADIFWARWVKEYLPDLQNRREPHGRGPGIQIDDLVQIVDANLPRNVWIRGRVVATYPGPDNIVRTVDVRTKGGVLRRPVRKLVVLPLSTADEPAPTDSTTSRTAGEMCGTIA